MESERRKHLKRKPFSDLTNTPTPAPRHLTKPSKPTSLSTLKPPKKAQEKPTPKPKPKPTNYETSIGSNNAENPTTPISEPSTPAQPKRFVDDDLESSKTGVVYSRRKTVDRTKDKGKVVPVVTAEPKDVVAVSVAPAKDKGKSVLVAPFSLSPPRMLRNIRDELDKEQGDNDSGDSDSDDSDIGDSDCINKEIKGVVLSKSCPGPLLKCKKKRHYSLPQDFIEKQRAYFAEIDAFELQEEVASEGDSE